MKEQRLILNSLQLVNFATFKDQIISFENGLNAIVGETGSGKSLVLDALELIFGAKAEKRNVRKDSEFATIEASFISHSIEIKDYFDHIGFPFHEDEIVIKRIIYPNGRSKSFINHSSCALTTLHEIATQYIDLVGQFENQKLLNDFYQLKLIDQYSGLSEKRQIYETLYSAFKSNEAQLANLLVKTNESSQRSDYLKFQLEQLAKLNPTTDGEQKLIERKNYLSQIEKRSKILQEGISTLSEGEQNVYSTLKHFQKQCESNKKYLADDITSRLAELLTTIESLSYDLSKYLNEEFNQQEFDEILEELDHYQRLKRKFGCDTDNLHLLKQQFEFELSEIEQAKQHVVVLENEILTQKKSLNEQAKFLHSERVTGCLKLSTKLTSQVQTLRMSGATLKFVCELKDGLTASGISLLDFLAETNPGEGFHKVKNIASGGELSRILLALRKIISSTDSISIFLFDEIDSGLGGKTAIAIGETLSEVASNSQVLAITHLPQIAQFAKKIIHVAKQTSDNSGETRTFSEVTVIAKNEREKFLADMTPLKVN